MPETKPSEVLSELKSFRAELHEDLNKDNIMAEVKAFREELTEKLQVLIDILYGKNNKLGLIARVHIIWSIWIWVLFTCSAIAGSAFTYFLTKN